MALSLTAIHERFGVEVHDIQLAGLTDEGFADIRDAFERHSLLLFRNQTIDDATHIALAKRFGAIENRQDMTLKADADFKVPTVSNLTKNGTVADESDLQTLNLKANMLWHCDSTFLPIPALTNILIARTVTKEKGHTEFATSRAGWADMPEVMKNKLRGRMARHHYAHSRARISEELSKLPEFNKWPERSWKTVWTNPVTGDEALYLASHAFAIEGMDAEEGSQLIDEALGFVTQPEYVYAHAWREDDVVIWDQRAVLHRATPWNYNEPRKLSSICVSASSEDGLDLMRSIG
ncbi:MAG: TauD/TfdA family dioxygenase [Rhodobacteraceae bacterium]|nr:TauD/TfdA family dioxygenase [Paracoccaceae bacterium]